MSDYPDLPRPLRIILNGIQNENTGQIHSGEIDELIRLIQTHRVIGPFHDNVPPIENIQFKESIGSMLYENKLTQLKLTSELIRIGQHFDEKDIKFIALKGPALSMLLYNDPTVRTSRDLDILISPENSDRCTELLESLGYKRTSYFNTPKQKAAYVKHYYHFEFYNDDLDVTVELHWRLTGSHAEQHEFSEILKHTCSIELSSYTLLTLNNDYLFEYLSVHGTLHAFFRLQWLTDIYFLIKKGINIQAKSESEIANLSVLTALDLCRTLFNTEVENTLSVRINRNKRVGKLSAISIKEIINNKQVDPRPKTLSGRWRRLIRIHRIEYLTGGFSAMIKSIFGRNVRPKNWKFFAFPDSVFFLNNVFSRLIWLIGRLAGKL